MGSRNTQTGKPFVPPGTELVRAWAARSGLSYVTHPDQDWFERWEPFDTMVAPLKYFNSATQRHGAGHYIVVEPWYEADGIDPAERTLLGYATHPRLLHRASARLGESFVTRVAFVQGPPPSRVQVGDPWWDETAATFAQTRAEAQAALHPRLRELLRSWRFRGHLELRQGGLAVNVIGLQPFPADREKLMQFLPQLTGASVA